MREDVDYADALKEFENDEYVTLEPWGMSVDHLKLTIRGKEGTPYEGGKFVFEIKMPPNYPYQPPYAYCHTLLWHPNIDSSIPPGKLNICLDLINPDLVGRVDPKSGASGWTPAKRLTNIVEALKGQIHMQMPFFNPGDPLNHEAGEQYLRAEDKFIEKARKWTKDYAMG